MALFSNSGRCRILVRLGIAMLNRLVLVAALFVFSDAPPALARSATIAQILANPSSYDGDHVSVSGTIQKLERKVSAKGTHYVTFSLCSSQCIDVYGFGSANISDGQTITVFGTFQVVRHLDSFTFNNAIHADYDSLSP